ncbi:urease subunit beta [Micromonospora sp. MED01]|uniref:urease subunit beta n=1 Tax=Micromonospora alfalfae TaxID=2911212 RepID=UPI001EE905E9|nr:urease subunit beta [Micromonospora alfalfae]MCG5466384.1 urease subunit beta [Micromonospora alfalfae]
MANQHPGPNSKHVRPIGGYVLSDQPLELNAGRPVTEVVVQNTGDRPIQVGSHFHFFEANRMLAFDREAAFGRRLNIPATTSIRFEPGDKKTVQLIPFGGQQRVYGFNGLVQGWSGSESTPSYRPDRTEAIHNAKTRGFKFSAEQQDDPKGKKK